MDSEARGSKEQVRFGVDLAVGKELGFRVRSGADRDDAGAI